MSKSGEQFILASPSLPCILCSTDHHSLLYALTQRPPNGTQQPRGVSGYWAQKHVTPRFPTTSHSHMRAYVYTVHKPITLLLFIVYTIHTADADATQLSS